MKKFNFYLKMFLSIVLFSQPLYIYSQTSGYKIIDKIEIGGTGGWDYLALYEPVHQLFVSHGSEVDVVNTVSNTVAGKIEGMKGVHGIAFAPEFGKGFITDGRDNTVVVFDLKTLKVIEKIKTTGEGPDAIAYDPFTKRIFSLNGHGGNSTAIDAKTDKVEGTVQLDGGPEFCVSDFNGHMFVNIEDKNEVEEFDPKTLKVINKWSLAPLETPTGLAIDLKNNRLFIGCRSQFLAVFDIKSGKITDKFPIDKGVDACRYDAETHLIFCSTKDGSISVVKQEAPDKYTLLDKIMTLPRAKTMELDPVTHRLYTSTMIEGKDNQNIFGVLVLDKN